MVILAAATPVDRFTPLLLALWLGTAAATAFATGVFRPRSIAGPVRIGDSDRLEPLTIIIFSGYGCWVCAALLMQFLLKPAGKATTPSDTVMILDQMAPPALTVAVVLGMIHLLIQKPQRLGLTANRLFPGFLRGMFSVFMVLPLMMLMLIATEHLWEVLHWQTQTPFVHKALLLLGSIHSIKLRLLLLLSILVVVPFSEEVFFRGCLQTLVSAWLAQWTGKDPTALHRWGAVLATSLVFTSLHDWQSYPPIFVLSLCIGYVYERTGNLWASIVIHAMFNAASVTEFFQTRA
jgi:membrane protease YdiL (CAAX protease family)